MLDDDDDTSDDNANSTISKVIITCCIGFLRRLFDLCSISRSADWVLEELESESSAVKVKVENLLAKNSKKYVETLMKSKQAAKAGLL